MSKLDVLVLEGDGIGPEVTTEAIGVLQRACELGGIALSLEPGPFGGACIDAHGEPITQAVLDRASQADGVLLGACGGPKWDALPTSKRPERGLLRLREHLAVFANLRPAKLFAALADSCPLRPERAKNFDFLVIRELVGGIYFGKPRQVTGEPGHRVGENTLVYSEPEIIRIGRVAFETAQRRNKKLLSVDKANVLEVMGLWREVMTALAKDYTDVKLEHMYVDNAAMQLILRPADFDVLVTGNMFGDILSDLAAAATGSIGLLPSAALGEGPGLYEPVHGSAPDIAGQGKANPLAAIMSVAMLLEHTAQRVDLAGAVNDSVDAVLNRGLRTADLAKQGETTVSTQEMGTAVLAEVEKRLS
ncbi:MAG: 3-isopropylmalate dehydrogenase [Myxococcales bacterium]|nr:3-isopropylmalate dehydrogenase [Myxococcales bacterium]MDD9967782.1 3-isopropylmalate dehydrogenase [Myxococcales bacterium]